MNMDLHPTSESKSQQREFHCADCGTSYFIAYRQQSSICSKCGNIAFHGENVLPLKDVIEDRKKKSTPSLSRVKILPKEGFSDQAEGQKVRILIQRYQVEWQMWAMLVKNFSDPNFHFAYYTIVANSGDFGTGISRYQEHRNIMLLQRENLWQAEYAEMMITNLSRLSVALAEKESLNPYSLGAWLYLIPIKYGKLARYLWVVLGMGIAAKIFLK